MGTLTGMEDAFAILGLERRPALDVEQVEDAGRGLVTSGPLPEGIDPAQINEAVRLLIDPAQRLKHLIALETGIVATGKTTPQLPESVNQLFEPVSRALQGASRTLKKLKEAGSPIVRAGLAGEGLMAAEDLEALLVTLQSTQTHLHDQLVVSDAAWLRGERHSLLAPLQELQHAFAFVSKWTAQVRETHFQLIDAAASL